MELPNINKQYLLLSLLIIFFVALGLIICKQVFYPFSMRMISPLAKDIIFDRVVTKLDRIQNTYKITEPLTIIPQVEANMNAVYGGAISYLAINSQNGSIIYEKNPDLKLPIASLTKLMSAVVALDLTKSEDEFTVPLQAAQIPPTIIGVVPGQKMNVGELLHAILLTSANDAAEVLSVGIDKKYKESVFIRAMNEKAQFIGLKHTHFENPQGFDNPGNFSSAYDLAELTHYAIANYPLIAQIVSQDYMFLPANQYHKQFDLYNWNGLLDVYPGVYGVKIGNTSSAGYTMVVGSSREGKDILVVVLGAPGIIQRDLWASSLLDDAFQTAFNLDPVNVTLLQLQKKYSSWKYFN